MARREALGAIRKLPSGRWQASYLAPDRVRRTAPHTFDTKGAARVWLADVHSSINRGTWQAPEVVAAAAKAEKAARAARDQAFGDYAEHWLGTRFNQHGEPLRATTLAEYRRLLRGPLAEFAEIPVPSITLAKVKRWRAAQLATGKRTQSARAYALLSSVMKSAVEDHLISESPCIVEHGATTRTGKEVKPPTEAEFAIILANLAEPYRSLALVAAWSGLRFGELTELRGRDVDIDGDRVILNVSRAVTHVTGEGAIVGKPKTDAGRREVPLPTFLTDVVRSRLHGPDDLLWHAVNSPTVHLRQSTLVRAWDPARRAAGRPDLPWHGLRHYAASKFSAVGGTGVEVAERLGQSSPGIARRYTHGTGREAVLLERMEAAYTAI